MWHWITALREKDGLEMPDSYWIRTLTECPGVRNSIHVSASVWCPALLVCSRVSIMLVCPVFILPASFGTIQIRHWIRQHFSDTHVLHSGNVA